MPTLRFARIWLTSLFRSCNGGIRKSWSFISGLDLYLSTNASLKYLPLLINKVEKICEENGLRNDSIVMRMTGCPNGCARPYVAGQRQAFLQFS
jgi:sulfite reductase beta subunit-like hemoprotein